MEGTRPRRAAAANNVHIYPVGRGLAATSSTAEDEDRAIEEEEKAPPTQSSRGRATATTAAAAAAAGRGKRGKQTHDDATDAAVTASQGSRAAAAAPSSSSTTTTSAPAPQPPSAKAATVDGFTFPIKWTRGKLNSSRGQISLLDPILDFDDCTSVEAKSGICEARLIHHNLGKYMRARNLQPENPTHVLACLLKPGLEALVESPLADDYKDVMGVELTEEDLFKYAYSQLLLGSYDTSLSAYFHDKSRPLASGLSEFPHPNWVPPQEFFTGMREAMARVSKPKASGVDRDFAPIFELHPLVRAFSATCDETALRLLKPSRNVPLGHPPALLMFNMDDHQEGAKGEAMKETGLKMRNIDDKSKSYGIATDVVASSLRVVVGTELDHKGQSRTDGRVNLIARVCSAVGELDAGRLVFALDRDYGDVADYCAENRINFVATSKRGTDQNPNVPVTFGMSKLSKDNKAWMHEMPMEGGYNVEWVLRQREGKQPDFFCVVRERPGKVFAMRTNMGALVGAFALKPLRYKVLSGAAPATDAGVKGGHDAGGSDADPDEDDDGVENGGDGGGGGDAGDDEDDGGDEDADADADVGDARARAPSSQRTRRSVDNEDVDGDVDDARAPAPSSQRTLRSVDDEDGDCDEAAEDYDNDAEGAAPAGEDEEGTYDGNGIDCIVAGSQFAAARRARAVAALSSSSASSLSSSSLHAPSSSVASFLAERVVIDESLDAEVVLEGGQLSRAWFLSRATSLSSKGLEQVVLAHGVASAVLAHLGRTADGPNVAGLVDRLPATSVKGSLTSADELTDLTAYLDRLPRLFGVGSRLAPALAKLRIKRVEQLDASESRAITKALLWPTPPQNTKLDELHKAVRAALEDAVAPLVPRLERNVFPVGNKSSRGTDAMEKGRLLEDPVRQALPGWLHHAGSALCAAGDGTENMFAYVSQPHVQGLWANKRFPMCTASLDGLLFYSTSATPTNPSTDCESFGLEIKTISGEREVAEVEGLAEDLAFGRVVFRWDASDEAIRAASRRVFGSRKNDALQVLHEAAVLRKPVLYVQAIAATGMIARAVMVSVDEKWAELHMTTMTTALAAHAPFMFDPRIPVPVDKLRTDRGTFEFNLKLAFALRGNYARVPDHTKLEPLAARMVNLQKSGVDATSKPVFGLLTPSSRVPPVEQLVMIRLRLLAVTSVQVYRIYKFVEECEASGEWPTSHDAILRRIADQGSHKRLMREMLIGFDANILSLPVVGSAATTTTTSVADAHAARLADPDYDPGNPTWEKRARAAVKLAISTNNGVAGAFRGGKNANLLRAVRLNTLPKTFLEHERRKMDKNAQRDCVLCCKTCPTATPHRREASRTTFACGTCGVALCCKPRPNLWGAAGSCWDVWHSSPTLPAHPFSEPEAAGGDAVMTAAATSASSASSAGAFVTQTESAKKRRRKAGVRNWSKVPRGRSGSSRKKLLDEFNAAEAEDDSDDSDAESSDGDDDDEGGDVDEEEEEEE